MYPFQSAFTPITPKELSVSDTTFKVFILPHFTGLTDRLPYGSGGFLLYQDSVVLVGIEPTTPWASTKCSTPELQYRLLYTFAKVVVVQTL